VIETTLHPKSMDLYLRRTQSGDFKLYTLMYSGIWPLTMRVGNLWEMLAKKRPSGYRVPPTRCASLERGTRFSAQQ